MRMTIRERKNNLEKNCLVRNNLKENTIHENNINEINLRESNIRERNIRKSSRKDIRKFRIFLVLFFYICALGFGTVSQSPEIAYAKTDISLNETSLTLTKGSKAILKVKGTKKKVVWSSSKPKVVSVDGDGKVNAKKVGTSVIKANTTSGVLKCKVTVIKRSNDSANKDYNKKIDTILTEIIENDMSTVEKIRACHDYLVLNTKYDYDNYVAGTIPMYSYSPKGVLDYGQAVCQGYAETFQLMMEALNIPSNIVIGSVDGGNHAWNQVKIDGKWYQIDVTWDDPVPDVKGRIVYNYFLLTDEQLSKDHVWNKDEYEVCNSEEYFYYVYQDYIVTNQKEAEALFVKTYTAGEKEITILLPKNELFNYDFIFNHVSTYYYYQPILRGKYYIYRIVLK